MSCLLIKKSKVRRGLFNLAKMKQDTAAIVFRYCILKMHALPLLYSQFNPSGPPVYEQVSNICGLKFKLFFKLSLVFKVKKEKKYLFKLIQFQ